MNTDEIMTPSDKILAVITNQYMLSQVLWYHSQFPDGIWEAVVIPFNENNHELVKLMYERCVNCGIFSKIYIYEYRNNYLQKIVLLFRYILQFIFNKRDRYDRKLANKIIKTDEYKKLIIHARNNRIQIALLNSMKDKVCICMEDGLGDYDPVFNGKNFRHFSEIYSFLLAKMNIVSTIAFDKQFRLKYDDRIIKYSSIPDRMQYRNYKVIKQLFDEEVTSSLPVGKNTAGMIRELYDIILFSSAFNYVDHSEQVYSVLHEYLRKNHSDKKILIKPHPRETYRFDWKEPNIEIGCLDMSGEEVLDAFPDAEIFFAGTSTILIKACRTKRDFKVIMLGCIKSKQFLRHIKADSQLMGITEDRFIYL